MKKHLVTRHFGAKEWVENQGVHIDMVHEHLDVDKLREGDHVLGTLPVSIVAEINQLGVKYWHLEIKTPQEKRGVELTAHELDNLDARLVPYRVECLA